MKNKKLLNFLQKRDKIFFNGTFELNENVNYRDSNLTSKNNFELVMKISTNTVSPIQKDIFGNWEEVIDGSCFDDSLKKELFCFLDHKVDSEHVLATTRNDTLTIEKNKNCYIARAILDPKNSLHLSVIDNVKKGVLNSNSFIFLPKEVEYLEKNKTDEEDAEYRVIHKKGELISIDPVMLPFYPTNNIEFFENETQQNEINERNKMEENILKKESDLDASEKEDIKKEDIDIDKSKKDKDKDEEGFAAEEADKADKEESEAYDDEEKERSQLLKNALQNYESSKSKILELKNKINSLKKEDNAFDIVSLELEAEQSNSNFWKSKMSELLDAKKTEEDNNKIDNTAKADVIEATENLEGENIQSSEDSKRNKTINLIKRSRHMENNPLNKKISILEIQRQIHSPTTGEMWLRGSLKNQESRDSYLGKLEEYSRSNPKFWDEFNLVTTNYQTFGQTRAALDGSSLTQGLAYISYINDPEIRTELARTMPEIEGGDFIQLDTLDIVKKDLMVPSPVAASAIDEGAESIETTGTTFSIEFKPTRYSQNYPVNPKLPNFAQVMDKATLNGKNSIITALRTFYYTNMFVNSTKAFATVSAASGGYTGGLTKESLIAIPTGTALTLEAIDSIINEAQATYGQDVEKLFNLYMNPETRTYIAGLSRKLFNGVWVMDEKNNTYRGIKIITAPMYPHKVNSVTGLASDGTIPLVFARKDCNAIRGFNFVIEDNPYINMSKQLMTRYQTVRGEMKLYDPFLNSRALYFGTIPTTK